MQCRFSFSFYLDIFIALYGWVPVIVPVQTYTLQLLTYKYYSKSKAGDSELKKLK